MLLYQFKILKTAWYFCLPLESTISSTEGKWVALKDAGLHKPANSDMAFMFDGHGADLYRAENRHERFFLFGQAV